MNVVRSRFGQKWISFEIKFLAETEFQEIEPLNLRACMRLRGLENLVDQTSGSWNRVNNWLHEIDRLRLAA